jgi:hypothetical protein
MEFLPLALFAGGILLLSEKRKIGKMVSKEDIEKIKTYGKFKYNLSFDKPTLVGIRGALPNEKGKLTLNGNENNEWNDSLVIITKDNSSFFQGSIDPGNFYIKKPMNSDGTARIEPGLYQYRKGFHGQSKHGNKFPAFVPHSNVVVKRDGNRNKIWNSEDKNFVGKFGINIHAQFFKGDVEANSAGCTVVKAFWSSETWKLFYNLLKSEDHFNYLVIDAKEII